MNVPFIDLRAHHDPIRAEIMDAIGAVVDANAFAGGPIVAEFEAEFAAYCGTLHCVGVANGTDALWLTLVALGVGPGDEVITVPQHLYRHSGSDQLVRRYAGLCRCGACDLHARSGAPRGGHHAEHQSDHPGASVWANGGDGSDSRDRCSP